MAGFGGSIKLTGESEYRKALREITDNLTVLSSEMKVVSSQYDRNDTSTANLAAQNEILNKRLEEQNKKLAEAKKMLREAETAEDSNAQTIKKWQTEVNKAQAEVNKTTRELEKNTTQIEVNEKAVDDLADSVEDAGKQAEKAGNGGFTVFRGILANLGAEVIRGVVSGLRQLASAAIELGKQAISAYADYEQLVGGVETLFKESSKVVEGYANDAYKTAGLSANEYMETVTSFSASLLSSLGQDTAKASQYADRAIIDMADNANKMGSDINSIQNAYQGFAKGTYTMLDNLKLGYGGTKTEMERLIADANRVKEANGEMADLSIDSFADITEAIHIIQTEMGITGTTAKEASTTITGSFNAMKSAWGNLLAGMADTDANFDQLIGNFVDSLMTVADNLVPRIQSTIKGMGKVATGLLETVVPEVVKTIPPLIEETMPILVETVQTVIETIVEMLPQIGTTLKDTTLMIINSILEMLPSVVAAGVALLNSVTEGIAQALPTLIPAVVDVILTIVNTLLDNVDMIIDVGFDLIMGLIEGIFNAIPVLVDRLPEIIEKIVSTLMAMNYKMVDMGVELVMQLISGIIQAIPSIIINIPRIIAAIVKGFGDGLGKIKDIGVNIMKGIWDGMRSWMNNLLDGVKTIGNSILNGFKRVFGIHSPSTVFADVIGKNLALGIGEGFESAMGDVSSQMTDAIPTDFNINTNVKGGSATPTLFADMVEAFKDALKEVNIVLDDEVAGKFVTDTVERAVYT